MCASALSKQTKQRDAAKSPRLALKRKIILTKGEERGVCQKVSSLFLLLHSDKAQLGSTFPARKLGFAPAERGLARNSNTPLLRHIHQCSTSIRLPAAVLSSPRVPRLAPRHPSRPAAARSSSGCPVLSRDQLGGCVAGETLWASSLTGFLLCISPRSRFTIPLSFSLPPRR